MWILVTQLQNSSTTFKYCNVNIYIVLFLRTLKLSLCFSLVAALGKALSSHKGLLLEYKECENVFVSK